MPLDDGRPRVSLPRTLSCTHCGAPVVLTVACEAQVCAACGRSLAVPAEVRAHLAAARALIAPKLAAAAELDATRGYVLRTESGAMAVAIGLLLVSCGGLEAFSAVWTVIDKGIDAAWPARIVPAAAGILAACAVGAGASLAHRAVRRSLERTFSARPAMAGAPYGVCHACGGALPASTASVVRCAYCRCDNVLGAQHAVDVASDLARQVTLHAEDLQASMRRARMATMLLGYGTLVLLPLASIAAWMGVTTAFE